MPTRREAPTLEVRSIAGGVGWRVSECVCDAGPDDCPFEESHGGVTIAAVLSGSFNYRTHVGESLMHPGAFLLGDAGRCYECGHQHSAGDRCVAFNFAPDYFGEIAAAATGSGAFGFTTPALPSSAGLLPLAARIDTARTADPLAMETLAAQVAFAVARTASGRVPPTFSVSARDERRVTLAMRYIEAHIDEAVGLDALARVAGASKFHFLRSFARVAGVSPYRYLLLARLRRAAAEIARGDRRISEIAFESGFGDLSTFNARFKATFGASPGDWRRGRGSGR